jgi:hypothetical protein
MLRHANLFAIHRFCKFALPRFWQGEYQQRAI